MSAAIEQRSADWFAQRIGLCTASRFKDAISRLKPKKDEKVGAPSQARLGYLVEVVTERLTGQPTPHFTTAAMQWGTDNEPAARIEYEFRRELVVEEVGFIRHPSIMAGASPDGLVGDDGLIEIKCPSSCRQVETWIGGMPDDHKPQVQGQLWITGRAWCDFVSYDPRMPTEFQFYVERIERDDIFIAALDAEVRAFLEDADKLINQLREKAGK